MSAKPDPRWRPQCCVCGRFVAIEAFDVTYDYYAGCWEEGYTACHAHGGPSPEEVQRRRETPDPWLEAA